MKKLNLCKSIISVTIAATMTVGLAGCSDSSSSSSSSSSSFSSSSSLVTSGMVENQLAMPEAGEQIAIFNIRDYGTFQCRLFPEAAPKAVDNFIQLAQQGKYNGVSFHRVIEDFMIQGGGNSESIYGSQGFGVELNSSLHHYNGALAVARTTSYTNGQSGQFYIVSSQRGKMMSQAQFDQLAQQITSQNAQQGYNISASFSQDVVQTYQQTGGYPSLDMMYTVFGQVFDGQDIVDKIAACPKDASLGADGSQSKPNPEIIIDSITITDYQG